MSSPPASYSGGDINAVLNLVRQISTVGDIQLSIIAHALVVACRSCKVPEEVAHETISELWARNDTLVKFAELEKGKQ